MKNNLTQLINNIKVTNKIKNGKIDRIIQHLPGENPMEKLMICESDSEIFLVLFNLRDNTFKGLKVTSPLEILEFEVDHCSCTLCYLKVNDKDYVIESQTILDKPELNLLSLETAFRATKIYHSWDLISSKTLN